MKNENIKAHEKKLAKLVKKTDGAPSMLMSTVNSLNAINQMIDTEMAEIDAIVERAANTKSSLTERRQQNERLLSNFNALLNVE